MLDQQSRLNARREAISSILAVPQTRAYYERDALETIDDYRKTLERENDPDIIAGFQWRAQFAEYRLHYCGDTVSKLKHEKRKIIDQQERTMVVRN